MQSPHEVCSLEIYTSNKQTGKQEMQEHLKLLFIHAHADIPVSRKEDLV